MYLAGPSDKGEPDISNLWLLMHGYLLGAGHLEGPPLTARQKDAADEMRKFESWVAQKRPDYFRETWFGNSVLEEAGGNHWKAAEEFKRLAEEYLHAQGGKSE
jgi:hypothetical protein